MTKKEAKSKIAKEHKQNSKQFGEAIVNMENGNLTEVENSNIAENETTNEISDGNYKRKEPTRAMRRNKARQEMFGHSVQRGPMLRDPEQEGRTIFVGNVPVKTKRKSLIRIFRKYGTVETIRIRSVAAAEPQISKKQAAATGKIHESAVAMNAYVRFETKDMMEAALEANNVEFMGHHLRVDKAIPEEKNHKLAIFAGNLDIKIGDDEFREFFAECGEITSVRVIRDKFGRGKGIGYVNFKSEDEVELALQLNGKFLNRREVRVKRAMKPANTVKKVKKEKLTENPRRPGNKGKPGKMSGKAMFGTRKVNIKKKANLWNKENSGKTFTGTKMVQTQKFKKMKKDRRRKMSKEDRKKLAIASKLARRGMQRTRR